MADVNVGMSQNVPPDKQPAASTSPVTPKEEKKGTAKITSGIKETNTKAGPVVTTSTDIIEVIRKSRKDIRQCYELARNTTPELEGRMVLSFTIEEDGTVSSSEFKESALKNSVLEKCLQDLSTAWVFPKREKSTSVVYPFIFNRENFIQREDIPPRTFVIYRYADPMRQSPVRPPPQIDRTKKPKADIKIGRRLPRESLLFNRGRSSAFVTALQACRQSNLGDNISWAGSLTLTIFVSEEGNVERSVVKKNDGINRATIKCIGKEPLHLLSKLMRTSSESNRKKKQSTQHTFMLLFYDERAEP